MKRKKKIVGFGLRESGTLIFLLTVVSFAWEWDEKEKKNKRKKLTKAVFIVDTTSI